MKLFLGLSLTIFTLNSYALEFTCGTMKGVQSDYGNSTYFEESSISGKTYIEILSGGKLRVSYSSPYDSRTYIKDADIVNVNLSGRDHISFAIVQNTPVGDGKFNLKTESYVLNYSKEPYKLFTGIAKTNNLGGNVQAYVSDCTYKK